VAGRLRQLAKRITICVVTGDTTGTARESVAGLPLSLEIVAGERQAEAKLEFASQFKREAIVAIGNGRNDRDLIASAGLSICIIGEEGCSPETLLNADVVCADIHDALDLLLTPRRLVATLRR
jgi:soluble P-type ATPase